MSQINGTVARQYEACASDTQDTCRVERSEKEGGRTFAGAEPPPRFGSHAETRHAQRERSDSLHPVLQRRPLHAQARRRVASAGV